MSRGQAGWKSRARKYADLLASNGMVKSDKVNISIPTDIATDGELASVQSTLQANLTSAQTTLQTNLNNHHHDTTYAKVDLSNITVAAGMGSLYIDIYSNGSTTSRDTARNWATASVTVSNGTLFVVRWYEYYSWYRGNGTNWGYRTANTIWLKDSNGSFWHIGGN